jgi:hypothetical protein
MDESPFWMDDGTDSTAIEITRPDEIEDASTLLI